jgi:enoyl-CoA hydratase
VIETTYDDGVAVVTMRHGKVNALDTVLCQALCGALDRAVADGVQAVVLTGAGTVFSAGVDLHRVIAGRDAYLASFLPELRKVFTRLATFELSRPSTGTPSPAATSSPPPRTGSSWPRAQAWSASPSSW